MAHESDDSFGDTHDSVNYGGDPWSSSSAAATSGSSSRTHTSVSTHSTSSSLMIQPTLPYSPLPRHDQSMPLMGRPAKRRKLDEKEEEEEEHDSDDGVNQDIDLFDNADDENNESFVVLNENKMFKQQQNEERVKQMQIQQQQQQMERQRQLEVQRQHELEAQQQQYLSQQQQQMVTQQSNNTENVANNTGQMNFKGIPAIPAFPGAGAVLPPFDALQANNIHNTNNNISINGASRNDAIVIGDDHEEEGANKHHRTRKRKREDSGHSHKKKEKEIVDTQNMTFRTFPKVLEHFQSKFNWTNPGDLFASDNKTFKDEVIKELKYIVDKFENIPFDDDPGNIQKKLFKSRIYILHWLLMRIENVTPFIFNKLKKRMQNF
eukprot:26985_1